MSDARIEFGEVRMSFANSEQHTQRAENISRLTFQYVQRQMERRVSRLPASRQLNYVDVAPVHVSFDTMDDDGIARASAHEIYRAILQML